MDEMLRTPTPSPLPSTYGEPREVRREDETTWTREVIRGGKHQGRSFGDVFANEPAYVKFLTGKHRAGELRDASLIELCRYAEMRSRRGSQAMMATKECFIMKIQWWQ